MCNFRNDARLGSNESVFSALLDTCYGSDVKLSTEPVHVLTDQERILKVKDTAVGLCITQQTVALATETASEYKIWLFKSTIPGTDIDTESKKQLTLPKRTRHVGELVCMKILQNSKLLDSDFHFSDNIEVCPSLFTQLFGMTIVLLQSAVCLFSTPDGNVYFAPFKYFTNIHEGSHPVKYTTFSRWAQLCDFKSPVCDAFLLSLNCKSKEPLEQSTGYEEALGICSSDGTVLLFSGSNGYQTLATLHLPGPVQTMCCHSNKLYHATDQHLYETAFVINTITDDLCQRTVETDKTTIVDTLWIVDMAAEFDSQLNYCSGMYQ